MAGLDLIKVIDMPQKRAQIGSMKQESEEIRGYHAHVYYEPGSRDKAARVREGLAARFNIQLGRWHDEPVGPHPKAMYQVVLSPDQFAEVVPWLMLNRDGLTVLVHPETGDHVADHRDHSLWLGEKLNLRLEMLGR
jgi:aromatic ring-cleaving dioxygenase